MKTYLLTAHTEKINKEQGELCVDLTKFW